MRRVTLYWCNGEYMTAGKVRRIKRKEGFDFDTAFRKSVYVDTVGDRIRKATKKALYYVFWAFLLVALFTVTYMTWFC